MAADSEGKVNTRYSGKNHVFRARATHILSKAQNTRAGRKRARSFRGKKAHAYAYGRAAGLV